MQLAIELDRILKAAKLITFSYLGTARYRLDARAQDTDDYQSMLVERGLRAAKKWNSNKQQYGGEDAGYKWVYASMWNFARNIVKGRKVAARAGKVTFEESRYAETVVSGMEEKLSAKQDLEKIERALPVEDCRMLYKIGQSGGCVEHAYRVSDQDIALSAYRKKARKLRERVKDIIPEEQSAISRRKRLYKKREESKKMNEPECPECYGQIWDGVQAGSPCKGCALSGECLVVFAKQTLPQVKKEMGTQSSVSPDEIGMLIGVSGEAVALALSYKDSAVKVSQEGVEPPGTAPRDTVEETPPLLDAPPSVIPIAEPVEIPEKEEGVSSRPPIAGSAISAADPANRLEKQNVSIATEQVGTEPSKTKRSRRKLAKLSKRRMKARLKRDQKRYVKEIAKPQVKQTRRPPEEIFGARYAKERARNKWIGMLVPGMRLRKVWKGQVYEVKVLQMGYQWEDLRFPTLYSLVMAITGGREYKKQVYRKGRPEGKRVMSAWSAPRFFNLEKLLQKAPH